MFFFIDIYNIKPVHLFSRGSISFSYLTWYKIIISVEKQESQRKKPNSFTFSTLLYYKGEKLILQRSQVLGIKMLLRKVQRS